MLNHELERITRLAAQVHTTRYAAVLLYQAGVIQVVALHGLATLDADIATEIATVPIHIRLGQPVIATTDDPSSTLSDFVCAIFPDATFFASVPISTHETPFLGALCVCHDHPLPSFGDAQLAMLHDFAALCAQTLQHNQRTHEAARAREAKDQSDALLRQSEAIISALFHSNLQAIFLVDRHATIQAWNKQATHFARLFNRQPIQYGDPFTAYLPTDDSNALHELHNALRGVGARAEYRYTKDNGHQCWYELDYTPVFDHHGAVSGVSISLIDVTARHETQTVLEEREQFLSALLDSSSDIIMLLSQEGIIRYQNAASERVLGYPTTERLGGSAFDYVHPADVTTARAAFADIVHTGTTAPITLRYQHANGQWLYLEAVGNRRYDDQNRISVIINARDVSQSHAVQARLLLLEAAIQHISESIVITNANLERPGPYIVYANRGFEDMTGYRADEVIGQNPRIFQGPKTTQDNRRRLREALARNEVFHGSTTNYRKDGSEYIVEWSVRPVTDPHGTVTHYVSVQRDVTERYREEQLGNDQRAVLEMVVQNRPLDDILRQLLLLIDHQDTDLWASLLHVADNTLRYGGHAGQPPAALFESRSVENLLGCMLVSAALVQHDVVTEDGEACMRCPLRPICSIKPECVIPLMSGNNKVTGLFLLGYHPQQGAEPSLVSQNLLTTVSRLATIVVAQRQLVERLEFQAYHDMLTGLPNRLFFEGHLNQALERAAAEQKMVALFYIDLDRFKQINDTLGHAIGDVVLSLIAERMEQTIPAGGTLVRMGGDEFAAILPDLHDTREATSTAQSLLRMVQQPMQVGEHQIFLTANIGISLYPLDGDDIATLQRNADIALYRSKRRNVNGMQYFTADMNHTLRQSLLELRSLEADMHSSTIFEQLVVYYQPQIDLHTGAIIGFEALIRWNHPEHGTLAPARFIPIAEQNGLIRPIGKWVIEQACALLAHWQQEGLPHSFISVNVSAAQFAAPDFVSSVEHMLHDYRLPASVLEVELTESLVFSDFELTARHLNDLQQLGVRIALDDFGTTPSTLSGLRWLPIDTLKIDKSFLRDSDSPPEQSLTSYDLLETVVKMAHNLNMKTVLEGIETEQHHYVATTLGCTRGQGYLFGKPALPAMWEPLLRQQYRFQPST